jgi:hypothetical protein
VPDNRLGWSWRQSILLSLAEEDTAKAQWPSWARVRSPKIVQLRAGSNPGMFRVWTIGHKHVLRDHGNPMFQVVSNWMWLKLKTCALSIRQW